MIRLYFLSVLAVLVSWTPVPDTLYQATIEYQLSIEGGSIDPMLLKTMDQSSMTISFKDHFVRVDQNMGFVKTSMISDGLKNQALLLSDIMGRKTAVQMVNAELEEYDNKSKIYEIELFEDFKNIAGYQCEKAAISDENGETILYFTPELVPANTSYKYSYEEFKGFPLEIIANQGDYKIVMTATNVSKTVKESFDMNIPKGYALVDLDQYQKMTGQY